MTSTCQPLPQPVVEEMLQVAARAICHRPGDTAKQRDSRTRQMVYSIIGFEPRDAMEYMTATMIVGHFHLILDSMHGVFQGQMDSVKAQTKTGVVALDRAMLAYVKELRLIRQRPLAGWAEEARRQTDTAAPVETPECVASWAGVPRAQPAAPAPEPVIAPAEPTPTQIKPVPVAPPPAAAIQRPMPPPGHDTLEHHKAVFEEALAGLAKRLGPEQFGAAT
jgi:hypothetical protein